MVDKSQTELAKHFGGHELTRRQQALDGLVEQQTTGNVRILSAGIRSFIVSSVSATENSATVKAQGVVWRDIAQVQTDGSMVVAHPANTMIWTLQLELTAGTWLVVDQLASFAPGSEP